jgi:hypothetical protein
MSSVTVTVPMTIRRRGGRKQIIGPDGSSVKAGEGGADVAFTRGDPALVKALARGFRWRRMLEEGRYGSIRELAAAEGVDRAYVGRVLNMTLLAPEVVEGILDGRAPDGMPPASFGIAPAQTSLPETAITERSGSIAPSDVQLSLDGTALSQLRVTYWTPRPICSKFQVNLKRNDKEGYDDGAP